MKDDEAFNEHQKTYLDDRYVKKGRFYEIVEAQNKKIEILNSNDKVLSEQFRSFPKSIESENKIQTLEIEKKLIETLKIHQDAEDNNKIDELREFKKLIVGTIITMVSGFILTAIYIALNLK